MTPADIRKLVAGYASGTLSEAERKVLFEAALDDQVLFDALADEEALRELLADAEFRGELLEALDEPEHTGPRHVTGPLHARRAPAMQGEMAALPAQAPPPPPAAMPSGVVAGAPKQAPQPLPVTPPPPPPTPWWRLPMYGGLAAALAVGIFVMFRPSEHNEAKQQVAQNRPADIQTRQDVTPPQDAPQSAPEPAPKSAPAPSRPAVVRVPNVQPPGAPAELAKEAERAPFRSPAQADTAVIAPSPQMTEAREQLRSAPGTVPKPQPATMAAAPPPPPPPKSEVAPAAPPPPVPAPPTGLTAMKTLEVAPTFVTAGPFRYRVEQLGADGRWFPAPAQLHAGKELRLLITPSETGNVVAALPDNRTEVVTAVANQPFTLPLPSTTGTLRVGLSLKAVQAETALRAKRLSQARGAGAAAPASKPSTPSSDVEIRLEILP